MSKFMSSFAAELTLIRRNYWTWLFFFVSLLYVGYTFSFFMQEKNPGGTLIASGFIIQGDIFVSLLLGLSLARREYFSSSEEVYLSLPNGFLAKMLGKLAALCGLILLFIASTLLILYYFYFQASVAAVMYQKAFFYLILYWGLTFLISGIIGMVVGIFVKSKAAYPIVLLIWTLIGPLNVSIYQLPMAISGLNATSFFQFINLGQTNFTDSYDPVYGLPMELYRWNQKGVLLLVVIGILWASTLIKNYKGKIPIRHYLALPVLGGLGVLMAVNFVSSQQALHTISHSSSSHAVDRNYYKQNNAVKLQSPVEYNITSYDIHLKTEKGLQAHVTMEMTPLANMGRFVFTLYHGLRVQQVKDEVGRSLQFQQKGDQTEIVLSSNVNKGQSVMLNVEYEGISSPYFFANEQAVMLPNYFPWLPTEGAHQAMEVSAVGLRRTPLAPQHVVEYSLHYQGNVALYTNLPQISSGEWKGTAPGGLTIAGGMLTETKVGSTRVIHPVTMENMLTDVQDYFSRTEQAMETIKRDWKPLWPSTLPETVFFLSTPTETNNFTGDIWLTEDHMIVNIDQSYNQGLLDYETSQVEKLLFAQIRSKETVKQDLDMHVLLVNSYDYWVRFRQGDHESANLKRFQQGYLASGKNREAAGLQQLMDHVEQHAGDTQLMQSFFAEWLTRLQQNENLAWNDLPSMLGVSKGGQ